MFNDKNSLSTKLFFSVIIKNLNGKLQPKHLVTF